MSRVKLNPYVDLGLSADPASQTSSGSTTAGDLAMSNSSTQSNVSVQANPNFSGISDLSMYGKNETSTQPGLAESMGTSVNPYSAINPTDVTQDDEIKVVQSQDPNSEKTSTIIMIISLVLFLFFLGIVIYLALIYFRVI